MVGEDPTEEADVRSPSVASVMTEEVISIRPETTFKEIVELLTGHAISAVPVVDGDGVPVGVVSEADLLSKEEFEGGTDPVPLLSRSGRRRWHQSSGVTAADVMNRSVLTILVTETIPVAARKLARGGVRRLFVVEATGRLVGVVSRRDLLKVYLRTDEQLTSEIKANVLAAAMWVDEGVVDVQVNDGVVTLAGTLPRRSEAEVAARLTRAQPGVVGVVDNLRYEFDDLATAGTGMV